MESTHLKQTIILFSWQHLVERKKHTQKNIATIKQENTAFFLSKLNYSKMWTRSTLTLEILTDTAEGD